MKNNILLFSFRSSHRKFFDKLIKHDSENKFSIKSTKEKFFFTLNGLKDYKKVNLNNAINFAVDEFYAKTDLKIPRILVDSFFRLLSFPNYLRYYDILNDDYDKMLIWNGGKFRQRIAIEIARKIFNIKVYFFENGTLPNRITFDSQGINYDNSVPRDFEFFQNYNCELPLPSNIIQRRGKREEKFSVEKNNLPESYIFVPFQVDYDTQIITNSHWIKNMRQLFDLIEIVAKKTSMNFILKEHPSSGKNYQDLHERSKNIDNISFENGYLTQDLISNSEAVITINSTVGIESLLFHKKVISLGKAFYQVDGISFKAESDIELIDLISSLDNKRIDFNIVDNYLKYLYYEYLVDKDDTKLYKEFVNRLYR